MRLQILNLFLLFSFPILAAEAEVAQDDVGLDEQIIESATQSVEEAEATELAAETADELAQELEVEASMPKTLNTLGVDDSGNWVLKRVWWEKAEQAFGKARALNSQIPELQAEYFSARNEVDKQLDAGKRALGLAILDVTKVVTRLLGMLGNEGIAELDGAKGGSFKGTILENKAKLEELQLHVDHLTKFDNDMDSVIVKVIDQVQKCNDYEAKAWEDFKQIGRVLNDEMAKKLYYQVVNYRKNIKLILNYLRTDLKASFEGLVTHSKAELDEIKRVVGELRDGGVDLVYELKAVDEGVMYPEKSDQDKQEPEAKKIKKATGLWGVIIDTLKILSNIILWLPRKIFSLFGIKF